MIQPSSPGTDADHAVSLGRVVSQVKAWVERCGRIWVEAQVIELRRRQAPTQFLTLRDPHGVTSARITCSAAVLDAAGPLTEGSTVLALLTPRVWSERAELTFECTQLRIAGEGRLLAQLEVLRRKLQAEGLFDPARRRPLPFLPRGIGLITGAGSAAERDVLATIGHRWSAAAVTVRHCLMQGPECAAQVMRSLAELDADPAVDVIIIARGGGSLEDLLPFSDEGLVRAVAAARTPVISAIGHEPDTPIIDLAADLRASTPTDAAKRVVPDVGQETEGLRQARSRLDQAIDALLEREADQLRLFTSRPVLRDPMAGVAAHDDQLREYQHRLALAVDRALHTQSDWLATALGRVRDLGPRSTLERGYAILTDGDGGSVVSTADAEPGDQLFVHLSDGRLTVEVDAVEPTPRTPAGRSRKPSTPGRPEPATKEAGSSNE